MIPIVAVVGWHDVGKTTLIERLVRELKVHGLRIATVKHSGGGFAIDHEGTDTWRYAEAGSDVVVITGGGRIAILEQGRDDDMSLYDIVSRLPAGIDLVIAEGFKRASVPKIEVLRRDLPGERIADPGELLAMVSDDAAAVERAGGEGAGWFHIDDAGRLANRLSALPK
jgi:molybdopterin-guanine dinucleotide biosynthesis protein B